MFETFRKHKDNARRVIGRSDIEAALRRELNEAQMQLMRSQSMVEFETAMVVYNTKRITRLKASIAAEESDRRMAEATPSPTAITPPESSIPVSGKVGLFPIVAKEAS